MPDIIYKREKLFAEVLESGNVATIDRTGRIAKGNIPINVGARVFRYELKKGIYAIAAMVEKLDD